jgi:hypothetical protein
MFGEQQIKVMKRKRNQMYLRDLRSFRKVQLKRTKEMEVSLQRKRKNPHLKMKKKNRKKKNRLLRKKKQKQLAVRKHQRKKAVNQMIKKVVLVDKAIN